jgi:hypothetical protein
MPPSIRTSSRPLRTPAFAAHAADLGGYDVAQAGAVRHGITRALIDLLGLLFFLLPITGYIAWIAWPFFLESFHNHEMSSNAGGLLRWPVKLLLPDSLVSIICLASSILPTS